jgi:predicted secreted protein
MKKYSRSDNMRKLKHPIFFAFLVALLIPSTAFGASWYWKGYDNVSLQPFVWDSTVTFNLNTGTIKVCTSYVDDPSTQYTLEAYEDDGSAGLEKLGSVTVSGNDCVYFYGAKADGSNGYAEVYFRAGLPTQSDNMIKLDVYQQ